MMILITGLPCTGKTYIAKKLSDNLNIPLFMKDTIKEIIFDTIGYSDREYSKKVSETARLLLFKYADEMLSKNIDFILESNFKAINDNEIFQNLYNKYNPKIVQILCFSDGDVLFERFKDRSMNGNRHPGHNDSNNLNEWKSVLTVGKCLPIDVECDLIEIDTTNFDLININDLPSQVKGKGISSVVSGGSNQKPKL